MKTFFKGKEYSGISELATAYVNGKAALTYHYTKGRKVAGITDISGKTTGYAYTLNGNLIQVTEDGKVLVTYEYDENSRILKIVFANGVTKYTYDGGRNMAFLTMPTTAWADCCPRVPADGHYCPIPTI